MKEFLNKYAKHASHFYVSGTLIEPYKNFYAELSGKEVQDIVFPDMRKTNCKMSIHPDRWRLNSHNFNAKFEAIISRIIEIHKENRNKGIYIVAPNAKKAKMIAERLNDVLGYELSVDYYRSDQTLGVEMKHRLCIAVGMAEVPVNTYDHQAMGSGPEERWIDSQRLRLESVYAATWQTWSRVKDPDGIESSEVYCIGVRADQIREVLTWGPGRRLLLKEVKGYKTPDGVVRKPVFIAVVDRLIEPPKIYAEKRTSARLDRHGVGEYIDRIERFNLDVLYTEFVDKIPGNSIRENIRKIRTDRIQRIDLNLLYYKNVDKMPINNIRQNVHKFAIYNNPSDDIEEWTTCVLLFSLYATRSDYVGIQDQKPKEEGRYGYCKHELRREHFEPALMYTHIRGRLTLGFYQMLTDDTVRWVCFDIDNHKGFRGPEEVKTDVLKLLNVLEKYKIPFLLEASGSPNSYHIWIFLDPTRTYNAFKFSQQIKAESGIECEVFPKQKRLSRRNSCGNLVKVPLGINWKTKMKSQFLDPSTFEPYREVRLHGYVRLREVPEPSNAVEVRMNESRDKKERIHVLSYTSGSLRPCMLGVLADNAPLNRSEGHSMRVAIVAEAYNIGLPIEAAVDLFRGQSDFDPNLTRRNVQSIYSRHYHRYSCSSLQNNVDLWWNAIDQSVGLVGPPVSKH